MKVAFLAGVILLGAALSAEAGIQVSVADDSRQARRIAGYIERIGPRYLAPNQNLKIEIIDYRRAERDPFSRHRYGFGPYWGDPWRFGYGHRYWRDPSFGFGGFDRPARIKLRYTLTENGRRVVSDTQTVSVRDSGFGIGRSWDEETAARDAVRRWLRRTVSRDRDDD